MNKVVRFIIHSKAAAYIAALLYIAVWCCRSVLTSNFSLSGCLGLLVTLVTGYLSVKVAREFSFGDGKNTLPATLFFMGCAVAPRLNLTGGEGIHLILFSVACYVLLRTYRDRNAMGSYFLAFALIGVECLMAPPLLLTLPWIVLCGAFMESLNGRAFFASLWGLLLPYWVTCGVLFLTDRTALIVSYLGQILPTPSSIPTLQSEPQLWMQLLWVLLLVLPGSVMVLLDRTMRTQANAGYRLLMLALVVLVITVVVSPAYYSMLSPCILLYASLIGATMFVGDEGRAKNIYLVALLVFWIASLGLYVWNTFLKY